MKVTLFFYVLLMLSVFSCGGKSIENEKPSVEDLKEIITQKEDSLSQFQKENKKIPSDRQYDLISSLKDFYLAYPNDKYAPVCLDKIQMSYSGLGVYHKAIEYSDILLKKYPNYINRPMILESQASNFDIFYEPRDTAKVRFYYTLLLKENPKLEKDKKEGIEMRLKHLDLTFNEYIDYIMNSAKSESHSQSHSQ